MRTLNIAMMIVGIIVLLAAGVVSLICAIYPGVVVGIGDVLAGPMAYTVEGIMGRSIALLISLAIVAFLLYLLWGNVQASRRERTVVLQNRTGEVLVSLPAIEDFARVLKGKIEGLRDIKGRVVYSRRGLKVSARISIFSDCTIADVAQNVQDEIKSYIQKTLNIEQEISPTVVVTKVVAREKPMGPIGIRPPRGSSSGSTEIPLGRS